jgi:hypothetical protein
MELDHDRAQGRALVLAGLKLQVVQLEKFFSVNGRVKVKSLCLTKHHAMKTYWGVEVYLHALLTSALYGGE